MSDDTFFTNEEIVIIKERYNTKIKATLDKNSVSLDQLYAKLLTQLDENNQSILNLFVINLVKYYTYLKWFGEPYLKVEVNQEYSKDDSGNIKIDVTISNEGYQTIKQIQINAQSPQVTHIEGYTSDIFKCPDTNVGAIKELKVEESKVCSGKLPFNSEDLVNNTTTFDANVSSTNESGDAINLGRGTSRLNINDGEQEQTVDPHFDVTKLYKLNVKRSEEDIKKIMADQERTVSHTLQVLIHLLFNFDENETKFVENLENLGEKNVREFLKKDIENSYCYDFSHFKELCEKQDKCVYGESNMRNPEDCDIKSERITTYLKNVFGDMFDFKQNFSYMRWTDDTIPTLKENINFAEANEKVIENIKNLSTDSSKETLAWDLIDLRQKYLNVINKGGIRIGELSELMLMDKQVLVGLFVVSALMVYIHLAADAGYNTNIKTIEDYNKIFKGINLNDVTSNDIVTLINPTTKSVGGGKKKKKKKKTETEQTKSFITPKKVITIAGIVLGAYLIYRFLSGLGVKASSVPSDNHPEKTSPQNMVPPTPPISGESKEKGTVKNFFEAVKGGDVTKVNEILSTCSLDEGCTIDINKIVDGRTPLHVAVQNLDLEMVKVLLNSGANTKIKDTLRNTPADLLNNMKQCEGALCNTDAFQKQLQEVSNIETALQPPTDVGGTSTTNIDPGVSMPECPIGEQPSEGVCIKPTPEQLITGQSPVQAIDEPVQATEQAVKAIDAATTPNPTAGEQIGKTLKDIDIASDPSISTPGDKAQEEARQAYINLGKIVAQATGVLAVGALAGSSNFEQLGKQEYKRIKEVQAQVQAQAAPQFKNTKWFMYPVNLSDDDVWWSNSNVIPIDKVIQPSWITVGEATFSSFALSDNQLSTNFSQFFKDVTGDPTPPKQTKGILRRLCDKVYNSRIDDFSADDWTQVEGFRGPLRDLREIVEQRKDTVVRDEYWSKKSTILLKICNKGKRTFERSKGKRSTRKIKNIPDFGLVSAYGKPVDISDGQISPKSLSEVVNVIEPLNQNIIYKADTIGINTAMTYQYRPNVPIGSISVVGDSGDLYLKIGVESTNKWIRLEKPISSELDSRDLSEIRIEGVGKFIISQLDLPETNYKAL